MSTDARVERPRLRSGKPLILATFSLFFFVPLAVVLILPAAQRHVYRDTGPPVWAERAGWQPMPVTTFDLEQGMMSQARNNATYKSFEEGFLSKPVDDEVERVLMRLSRMAFGSPGLPAFESEAGRLAIEAALEELPGRYAFYPRYLLGRWHEQAGDDAAAAEHFDTSFRYAEAVLMRRFVLPRGDPAAGHDAGRLVLGFDQIDDDQIDTNLRLTYPGLVADDRGKVYLPVFKTVYRIEHARELTAPPPVREDWFTFPGRFGELEPATVFE